MRWPDGELYSVELPYACYAIVVRDQIVVFAAPIATWMIGKDLSTVTKWIRSRGGHIDRNFC